MGMFKNTLLLAQQGNEKAMEKLLNRYDPLLKKCSCSFAKKQKTD